MISDKEKLEKLIVSYKRETDIKKKHIKYLQLIEATMEFVKRIVSGIYIASPVTVEDIVQVGAIGALKAIDSYDCDAKGSFKTYATIVVRGQILHFIRDKANIVRLPRDVFENLPKVRTAIEKLGIIHPEQEIEELANYLGLPPETILETINLDQVKNMVSLDQNVYTSEGTETLLDRLQLEDNNNFENLYETKKILEIAIEKLPEIDKAIITKYYMEGFPQKTIAAEMQLTQSQVSRIVKRALNKLYFIMQEEEAIKK